VAKASRIISEAFERVSARHRVTADIRAVSFEQFLHEVVTEVCVEIDRRTARDLRRIRKASRQIRVTSGLLADMGRSSAFASAVADRWFADLDPAGVEVLLARTPASGPPSWHPEYRPDPETDQE
jgi:hypothetical protein